MDQELPTVEVWLTFAGMIDNVASGRLFGVLQQVIQVQGTKVHLLIQSAGGIVGDGVAMYNFLRHLPIELTTYNAGAVESIAVLPYLAGKVRRANDHATFMVHKTAFPLQAPAGAMELSVRAEASRLFDENVEAILRSEITLPDEKWATHKTSDLVFNATDAMTYKLVHEIADFKPPRGAPLLNI